MLLRALEIKKEHVDGSKNVSIIVISRYFQRPFPAYYSNPFNFKIWSNSPDIELLSESNFRESRTTGRLAYVNVLHKTSHFQL